MKKNLLTLLAVFTLTVSAQEGGRKDGIIETTPAKHISPMGAGEDKSIEPVNLHVNNKETSTQYFNDVIIESSTLDQRDVKISSAFNGWLYAAYSTSNTVSGAGGITIRRSKNNGVTWSTLTTVTLSGSKISAFDIVVAGTDTNNLTLFNVGVNNNISGGTYILYFDKYNATTGAFIGNFCSNNNYGTRKVYDVSIATDYRFPAVGSSPYSVGVLYSVYSTSKDSIIFVTSNNGGASQTARQNIASTSLWNRGVSLAYGRSSNWSNGRFFGVWEQLSSSTARNGNIFTSRSASSVSGPWIANKNLDSTQASMLGNCRNPDIAVQYNNLMNDSSSITAAVVVERDWTGTGSDYDVIGFYNKNAAGSNYWKYFGIVNTSEKDNSPDMIFDPGNNNFLAVYHDSTNHKLPYCINDMNISNPTTWGYVTTQYNDLTTNIISPFPRVDINPVSVKTVHVWNSEGAGGKGVALFDAENLYTSVKEVTEPSISSNVYPNPASTVVNLNFELKNLQDVTMEVIDTKGNVVKQEVYYGLSNGSNRKTINIADLPDGIYILKLSSDKVAFTKKIVKVNN